MRQFHLCGGNVLEEGEAYVMLDYAPHEDMKSSAKGVEKGDEVVFLGLLQNLDGDFLKLQLVESGRRVDVKRNREPSGAKITTRPPP